MPTPNITWTMDTEKLDAIIRDANMTRDQIIKRAAFEIEAIAKRLAPVDTSALRNSIYTVTPKEDNYQQAESSALSKNPEAGMVEIPTPPEGCASVGPAVEYGIYQEFGTSKMAAQPYMTPAFEQVKAKLEDGRTYKELVKE